MKKYQIVAKKIIAYIAENHLQQGDKLPKITEMVEQFDVSKATILQALTLLNQQGIIYKVQGSGIFVRMPAMKDCIPLYSNSGFSSYINDIKVKVIEFKETTLPDSVQKILKGSTEGYKVVRVHYNGDKPYVLEESYYSKKIVPFLSEEIVKGPIFEYLREGLGLQLRFSDKYLEIRKITAEEARLLELNPGDPGLQVSDIYYCDNGIPFDCSKLVYNYQNSKIYAESSDELI